MFSEDCIPYHLKTLQHAQVLELPHPQLYVRTLWAQASHQISEQTNTLVNYCTADNAMCG